MTNEEVALLVTKLQNGDESAFDTLFTVYKNTAVRTAALITGDFSLAEDIVQDTFVKCLTSINTLKDPYKFYPWLLKILTHFSWKASKKKSSLVLKDEIYEDFEDIKLQTKDSYPSDRIAEYSYLYEAVYSLNTKQRTTLILYYFNDLSIKEIAKITNSLEATVKSRLHAAKKSLKKSLNEKYSFEEVVGNEG